MADPDEQVERLRQAYEELMRRVVADRLAFADRVQELLADIDRLQAGIDDRDEQIRKLDAAVEALSADAGALRERVDSLHAELVEAHRNHERLEGSRSVRYTAPLRRLAGVLRR